MQKVRVDTAAAAVEEAESIVAKASAQIKSSERAAEKAVAAAAAAAKQLELIAVELAEVKADVDDIMKKAAESMTDCEAAQGLVDKRRSALQACEAAYDKMRGGLSLLRQSELDLTAKWEESARALQEAKRRCDLQIESLKKVREEARIESASLLADGIDLSELLAAAASPKEEEIADEEEKSRGKKAPAKKMVLANVPTAILNDALAVDFDEATLATLDAAGIEHEVVLLGESVDSSEESLDLGAIARWRAAEADYRVKLADLDETTARRDVARAANDDLRKARLDEFMSGFGIISMRLKEMYQMITLGGDAELELVDSLDPFSEGVVFSVRPPKKSWKNISNLSGGEKTLSSLALVFALHYFKPTPLYVMDEIDAALDFQNVSIVANYIRERTKDAQFIIISLRNNMYFPLILASQSLRWFLTIRPLTTHFPSGLSLLTAWSAFTRHTTAPRASPSTLQRWQRACSSLPQLLPLEDALRRCISHQTRFCTLQSKYKGLFSAQAPSAHIRTSIFACTSPLLGDPPGPNLPLPSALELSD